METTKEVNLLGFILSRPHSLGKLIEWKQPGGFELQVSSV